MFDTCSALYEDSCLYLVPGSHKLPRSSDQRLLSESMDAPDDPLKMPGSIQITLKSKF